MSLARVHHRFSVDEYHQMIETGILDENDRVELIRGEIVDNKSIGDLHFATVNRLNQLLTLALKTTVHVSVQNPVLLVDSEPEPDIALLKPRDDYYASGKPQPKDVLLIIEVADTTLEFDRDVKGPLYAENGVGEYWIVNLIDDCIEIYRRPGTDGTWGEVQTIQRGDEIDVVALPSRRFAADQII